MKNNKIEGIDGKEILNELKKINKKIEKQDETIKKLKTKINNQNAKIKNQKKERPQILTNIKKIKFLQK